MQIWNLAYQGVTHICATHWRGPSNIHCDVLVRVPIDVLKTKICHLTLLPHMQDLPYDGNVIYFLSELALFLRHA